MEDLKTEAISGSYGDREYLEVCVYFSVILAFLSLSHVKSLYLLLS